MTDRDFEIFFRDHFNALTNLSFSVIKDKDDARDVVQHVFLTFWQKRSQIVIRGTMKSYLYKSVLNASITRFNQSKKIIRLQESEAHAIPEQTEPPEDEMLRQLLDKAINDLPPVCQQVFRLSRFSDLSNREIADELNISVKAVEKHITKAFKFLRETLIPVKNDFHKQLIVLFMFIIFMEQVGFYKHHLS
jgi:RNA polymerase sigma-70 factor (ECF subfamily)